MALGRCRRECFLALDEVEADWLDRSILVESPEGHFHFPGVIHKDQVELVRRDIAERRK